MPCTHCKAQVKPPSSDKYSPSKGSAGTTSPPTLEAAKYEAKPSTKHQVSDLPVFSSKNEIFKPGERTAFAFKAAVSWDTEILDYQSIEDLPKKLLLFLYFFDLPYLSALILIFFHYL